MADEATAGSEFDLEHALDQMPDQYLACRDYGHSWISHDARYVRKERIWLQSLICQRCETVRHRELGQRGPLLGNGYDYAPGYLMPGAGRLTGSDRDGVRLRSLQRLAGVRTIRSVS